MKVRNGFISNSSSSSFLLYGIAFDDAKMVEYFDVADDNDAEYTDYDKVSDMLDDANMEWHSPEGYDTFFIGKSLADIGEDETLRQFKARTREKINKITKKEIPEEEFGIHEEAYYG